MKTIIRTAVLISWGFFGAGQSSAQVGSATLTGTVLDPSERLSPMRLSRSNPSGPEQSRSPSALALDSIGWPVSTLALTGW